MPASSDHHIGKYEIAAEIRAAKHPKVRVFRAFDRALSRRVIVKLVADAADRQLADRFRREVCSIAQLRVPNLIAVYELAEHGGLPFAAMQELGDDNLEKLVRSNHDIPLFQKMLCIEQVALGAAEAYRAGLAYIGLRPAGIALAGDSTAVIQDFGIVRLSTAKQNETELYGAPEEAAHHIPDLLCDIFTFGVICYEFLTGSHPFRDGAAAACDWHREVPALRQVLPRCPEALEQLVSRLLETRREFRYPNFEGIRDELRPIVQQLRRDRAAELWADTRRLIDQEQLEEAQGTVRTALQLDPDDTNGQQISNDLRVLLYRRKTRTKIEDLWRQAEEAAGNRRFFAAVEILESAARLDGEDAETRARLDHMRTRLGQNVDANQLTAEAQRLLDQGALDQARVKALKALERDPEHIEAGELLQLISETAGRQEKQARIDKAIAQAKSLALEHAFDEALAVLNQLQAENSDSPLLRQWIEHVEGKKHAAERQDRLRTLTISAESLLGQQRFSEAMASLEPAIAEFPDDPTISDLLLQARDGSERIRILQQTSARCDQLCQQQQFDQALTAVDRALAANPSQPELLSLRQNVESQAQKHRRAASIREALEQVEWLLDQDRLDLAIRFLKQQHVAIAGEPKLAARLEDLEARLPDWELRRFVDVVEEFSARPRRHGTQPDVAAVLIPVLQEALQAGAPGPGVAEAAERLQNNLQEQAIVAKVRHYLAADDVDRAQEIFDTGLKFLRGEASINAVKQQIEAGKKYAGERQTAEVLLGRRHLGEAEQLLVRLAKPDRPEIQELLELVRELRAAADERGFHARVKETALMLAKQGKPEEADRLFRRLAVLFPSGSSAEDGTIAAASRLRSSPPPDRREAPAPAQSPKLRAPSPFWRTAFREQIYKRGSVAPKVAVLSGALILTAAGGAVWQSSRVRAVSPRAPVTQAVREIQPPAPPAERESTHAAADTLPPQEARLSSQVVVSTRTASVAARKNSRESEPAAPRPFKPPVDRQSEADRVHSIDLPAPPNPGAGLSRETPVLAIGQPPISIPPPQPKA
ncbi:MAG TPA: protein kinase, partial [Bryobacteraceae bacterium]|nr:protein kinase [Bryobacteraceae bacterium]